MLVRRIIQAASFVLFPGLFISTFAGIKTVYTAILNGTFSIAQNAGDLILVISMLLITAIMRHTPQFRFDRIKYQTLRCYLKRNVLLAKKRCSNRLKARFHRVTLQQT